MPLRNTRFEPGNRAVSGSPKLGTFLGLYTPTILTILGVIMYLRFGWLVALAYGAAGHYHAGMFSATVPSGDVAFWTGFAVFFPAATGVMAGLGLSGDLKEPGISIPVGSLLAVVTGFAVYLFVPFLLIMGADAASLRNDSLIWTKVAPFGTWLVLPALFGAIFSSAIGSMLTAPRSLYTLSRDRIGPRFLGRATGDWRELFPGFVVTLAIALGGVLLGNLNAVAPVVTMFFLTVYGIVNLVAALESLSRDPSWRPKIRIPWPINLLGAFGCSFAMFLISSKAAVVAIIIEIVIWLLLSRRERTARWGDARRGLYETLIRWGLDPAGQTSHEPPQLAAASAGVCLGCGKEPGSGAFRLLVQSGPGTGDRLPAAGGRSLR